MDEDHRKYVIALDSNCLTYLLTVIDNVLQPSDNLATEKIALYRIFIYVAPLYYTNTVKTECGRISDKIKKAMHENDTLLSYHQIKYNLAKVSDLDIYYNKYHTGLNDCSILAEAEIMKADILLTYDDDFYNRLRCRSHHIKLLKPSECWDELSIPHGTKPKLRPLSTNPFSNEMWPQW